MLNHRPHCPPLESVLNEVMPIDMLTLKGKKQTACLGLARVNDRPNWHLQSRRMPASQCFDKRGQG